MKTACRPLAKRIGGTHVSHQIARGQNIADIGGRQRLAVMFQHMGPVFNAARGQGDVAGDDDVTLCGAIRDPHIGHVGAVGDDDGLH